MVVLEDPDPAILIPGLLDKKTVLLTCLFVGTTDLLNAYISIFIKTGKFAGKLFYYIAGGAPGPDTSLKGGNGIAHLGLFFHYFIAFAYTLFFFLLFPRLKFLAYRLQRVQILRPDAARSQNRVGSTMRH